MSRELPPCDHDECGPLECKRPECQKCGERIRGHSYLKDGRLLCGLCLDDEMNAKAKVLAE